MNATSCSGSPFLHLVPGSTLGTPLVGERRRRKGRDAYRRVKRQRVGGAVGGVGFRGAIVLRPVSPTVLTMFLRLLDNVRSLCCRLRYSEPEVR